MDSCSENQAKEIQFGQICRTISNILALAAENPKIQQRVVTEFRHLKEKYTGEYLVSSKSEIDRRIKGYEKAVGSLKISPLELVKSIVFPGMKKKFMECNPDLVWKRSTNVRLSDVCAVLDTNREMWDYFFLEFDKKLNHQRVQECIYKPK